MMKRSNNLWKARSSMLDWLRAKVISRFLGRCPVCGSKRVSVTMARRPPFVVDGPRSFDCRCRACGHIWRQPVPISV